MVEAIGVGDPLPDCAVQTVHGKTVSLTEVQGPGPVVLIPFRGFG